MYPSLAVSQLGITRVSKVAIKQDREESRPPPPPHSESERTASTYYIRRQDIAAFDRRVHDGRGICRKWISDRNG